MICSRDLWTTALDLVRHATLKPTLKPTREASLQLTEIELRAVNGRATVLGMNGQIEMHVQFMADGHLKPIPVPLDALRKITRAGKATRGEEVEITPTATGIRLHIGGRTFELARGIRDRGDGFSNEDWSESTTQSYGGDEFSSALRFVTLAMGKDPTRPNLSVIHLDEGRMVATDGHRMHVVNNVESFPGAPISLPAALPPALLACIKATDAPRLMVQHRPRPSDLVRFHLSSPLLEVLLTAVGIDQEFPPYGQIVPTHDQVFALDGDGLRASLATVRKLKSDAGVRLAAHRECLVELCDGQFSEVLPLRRRPHAKTKLIANSRYLLDAVAYADDLVRVEYGDTLDPILIRSSGDRFAVVMPLRP